MEKLQGPINPCLIGEDLDVGWLEEFVSNLGGSYRIEDSYTTEEGLMPSLEDKRPFLQMLQGAEVAQQTSVTSAATFPFMQEPNYFQLLLRLQHQKMILMEQNHQSYCSNFTSPTELESCVSNITTNNNNYKNDCVTMELQSPVKSETCRSSEEQLHAPVSPQKCADENQRAETRSERPHLPKTSSSNVEGGGGGVRAATGTTREKRKRKRPDKPTKNKEEVESQRMTHIAVERNRRRLMNDHLNALRSLMPPSYVQRGDQASIVGGAIDFVKEMEQLLQSLQAQKRMRQYEENTGDISATSSSSSSSNLINNMFITSPTSPFQFKNFSPNEEGHGNGTEFRRNNNEEFSAENRSALADIKVVMIQNHVNLKIQCQRRPGQLLKAVVAFEELRLTILHLNITSLHSLVHYTFNLKIEDDCKLGSADEVVRAVHHIFSLINLS